MLYIIISIFTQKNKKTCKYISTAPKKNEDINFPIGIETSLTKKDNIENQRREGQGACTKTKDQGVPPRKA